MPPFDPSELNVADPVPFYLPDEELREMVDSTWLVGADKLPVHSQIVSQRSHVLRAAYRAQLQESLALADELQLNNLRATILLRIAKQLASGGSSWASPSTAGMLEAAQLVGLSQANLCLVLGALSAALKHTKPNACSAVLGRLPQAGTVAKWGRLRHGATGDFTWEGEGFDSAAGDVDSPPFTIGGEEWKLRLYPKGDGEEAAGHASLYLMLASPPSQAQTDVAAAGRLTIVNPVSTMSITHILPTHLFKEGSKVGVAKMAALSSLLHHGFLVEGRLKVRAEVVC